MAENWKWNWQRESWRLFALAIRQLLWSILRFCCGGEKVQPVAVTLKRPISQFVERQSQERKVSPQEAVSELVTIGFETLLERWYQRYRRGDISFGRLAQELGVTTWELSHLLEERNWSIHNLPSAG